MTTINTSRRSALGIFGASLLATGLAPSAAAAQSRGRGGDLGAAVTAAHHRHQGFAEGKNADYIPALAAVPSTYFGVAGIGSDGAVHEAGDTDQLFSIQSISKVFTMALVMKESGQQLIIDSVGVDATGRVFNSIDAIEQYRGKEMNPLVNPGAIATTGNVKGNSPDEVWNKILGIHSEFAGRQLEVNQEVYKSESDTNQRNRAIGSLMWAYERFPMDPLVATDLYTRQCSINVNAKDLANMAATLAFGGRNPVTGRQVIDSSLVPGILSIMATAGLYDDSGKWLFKTGLPAKSGVGGGLIAVSPGKFGVGTFSPPLDEAGNSVRGQRAIADITDALHANPYAQFS
ncbi:MAG: glutaminase [Brevundimonas sp.]|nr:MAG: glutaminase [Brevundimonas sp.]